MAQQPGALSELPLEQLARVLSWLPLGERLACAPVSRAWRAAAAAATTSVSVPGKLSQAKADSLSAWIAQRGEQLHALSVSGGKMYSELGLASSRLPQLRSLELSNIMLEELPGAEQQQQEPSSLAGLPQLERLRLEWCTLAWRGGLAGLSALSQLQSLELAWLIGEGCTEGELAPALASAWPQLHGLTRLHLGEPWVTAASALVGLSSCSNLEELSLAGRRLGVISLSPSQEPGVFSEIAQLGRLKRLHFGQDFSSHTSYEPDSSLMVTAVRGGAAAGAPSGAAPALSSLQRLQITHMHATLDPLALAELPQLQCICLSSVHLAGSSALQANQQLLAQLGCQTQLVELELGDVHGCQQQPPAAYSALTASNELTRLRLEYLHMPAGVAVHLFGPGRSLPRLQGLHIQDCADELFSPGDLQRMVAAAPGLRSLALLHGALPLDASLQPLSALAELAPLRLEGEVLTDAAMGELARLPALADLHIERAGRHLTWLGGLQLTALRGLTSLLISSSMLLAGSDDEDYYYEHMWMEYDEPPWLDGQFKLNSTAPKGQPSDVPARLRAECRERDWRRKRADVLQLQLAGEDAQLAQAQLAEARAQLAGACTHAPSTG